MIKKIIIIFLILTSFCIPVSAERGRFPKAGEIMEKGTVIFSEKVKVNEELDMYRSLIAFDREVFECTAFVKEVFDRVGHVKCVAFKIWETENKPWDNF